MRTLLIIFFINIFVIWASGQEKKEADFLQMSFEIKEKSVCIGGSLNIFVKFTNKGMTPAVIDVNRIGEGSYFERYISKTKRDPNESFTIYPSLTSPYNPNFIILQPMSIYTVNRKFVVNSDFFTKVGRYRMQLGYRQPSERKIENINVWKGVITSNKMTIFIKRCGNQ